MARPAYPGNELPLFSQARKWKQYWSSFIVPYVRGDVIEVGAGIGSNTTSLRSYASGKWLCLEPDTLLAQRLEELKANGLAIEIYVGTLKSLPAGDTFDLAFYGDVLEHIADDAGELVTAATRLRIGGHLVVLAPANEAVFGPFDRSIGHFRRYSKASLLAIQPPGMALQKICYLDSAGLVLLAMHRSLLSARLPTRNQILIWDRLAIPISKIVDRVLNYQIGKSVLAVWRKDSAGDHALTQPALDI